MKQILCVFVATTALLSAGIAENAIGIRGTLAINRNALKDSVKQELADELADVMSAATESNATASVDDEVKLGGGFAIFGNFSFSALPALGVQCELGLLFNNGITFTGTSSSNGYKLEADMDCSFSTLEFPILLTYTVNKGGFFEFVPEAGLYLAFPITKFEMDMGMKLKYNNLSYSDSDSSKSKIDTKCFVGMVLGVGFALNFTSTSAIIIDTRYMFDFNKLEVDGDEIGARRVFLLSAGYRYTLK